MKSLKAEAEAIRDHAAPVIEVQLLICASIGQPASRASAESQLAAAMKDGWHVMFANFDSHSSGMIYTMSRSIAPQPQAPAGIAVR